MTDKQRHVLDVLREMDVHPTVRSLADRLETRRYKSERWSDDEVRGLLERLYDQGLVAKYTADDSAVRYKPVGGDNGGG